jgi:hypothetical protein
LSDIKVNWTYNRQTPLYIACENNREKIVKLLLTHQNIDVNMGYYGKTPLYVACENNYEKIVELLLKHPEIDVNMKYNGETPLYNVYMINRENIVKLLLNDTRIDYTIDYPRNREVIDRIYNNKLEDSYFTITFTFTNSPHGPPHTLNVKTPSDEINVGLLKLLSEKQGTDLLEIFFHKEIIIKHFIENSNPRELGNIESTLLKKPLQSQPEHLSNVDQRLLKHLSNVDQRLLNILKNVNDKPLNDMHPISSEDAKFGYIITNE